MKQKTFRQQLRVWSQTWSALEELESTREWRWMQNLVWFTNGLSCGGEKGRESETEGERKGESKWERIVWEIKCWWSFVILWEWAGKGVEAADETKVLERRLCVFVYTAQSAAKLRLQRGLERERERKIQKNWKRERKKEWVIITEEKKDKYNLRRRKRWQMKKEKVEKKINRGEQNRNWEKDKKMENCHNKGVNVVGRQWNQKREKERDRERVKESSKDNPKPKFSWSAGKTRRRRRRKSPKTKTPNVSPTDKSVADETK